MRWLDTITNSMDMNWSTLLETVEDSGAWYAVVHKIKISSGLFFSEVLLPGLQLAIFSLYPYIVFLILD